MTSSAAQAMVTKGVRLRLRLHLQGVVQGVGFRPHAYRLATAAGLSGWVENCAEGVVVEAEGSEGALRDFSRRLEVERPPGSSIQSLEAVWLDPVGCEGFEIRRSDSAGTKTVLVRPDVATCAACVDEIFDPGNRRFGYPFTNCTHCGPRYSIIEALPYDRGNTSMKRFRMCPDCHREYEDPGNRRFHAQPNACPECGPQLELWSASGAVEARGTLALERAAQAVLGGAVLAVKGLGGFQLMADARDGGAVERLRSRKHREEKPFAIMMSGIAQAGEFCLISDAEERLLLSPEAPIVLLRSRQRGDICSGVAPGNPFLGVMLPYTPLHHLLLARWQCPVVATSGNLSDEPLCIDEFEAKERLRGIADYYLVHDRPIVRPVDDSVVRVVAGREVILRRARGYAPLPVSVIKPANEPDLDPPGTGSVLAVGGQQKNTVALSNGRWIVMSQHVGDLENVAALQGFRKVVRDLQRLFEVNPRLVVADLHPDYASRADAQQGPVEVVEVQHHHAHLLACMAENELEGPVLGVAWDGTGYGTDGMIWGGEFMIVKDHGYDRFATVRPFRLPGNSLAVREPRRSAAGLLFEHYGSRSFERGDLYALKSFNAAELRAVRLSLERPFNAPLTTAVGRLFDGVASLLGLHDKVSFEGQAAMALEFLATGCPETGSYDMPLQLSAGHQHLTARQARDPEKDPVFQLDWGPLLEGLLADVAKGMPRDFLAMRFHRTLMDATAVVAERAGVERIALSGGCFQNGILLEGITRRLQAAGHRVYWHQRVPPNDGGLALGQVMAGIRMERERR
jgi:hydrogenase maturation protein HypF